MYQVGNIKLMKILAVIMVQKWPKKPGIFFFLGNMLSDLPSCCMLMHTMHMASLLMHTLPWPHNFQIAYDANVISV